NVQQLGEVLLQRGKLVEAKKNITLWLTKTSGTWIREHWSSALPVLQKLIAEGLAPEFGALLQRRENDSVLRSLGRALTSPKDIAAGDTDDALIAELKQATDQY
ncbi:MAG: hypothetical protein HC846_11930, partial [Blastocatellia bacterium]|nr:hypothetical protein [Blastocatellia bacterium]